MYAKGSPTYVVLDGGVLRMKTQGMREIEVPLDVPFRNLLGVSVSKSDVVYVVGERNLLAIRKENVDVIEYPKIPKNLVFAGKVMIRREKRFVPSFFFDSTEITTNDDLILVDGEGTQIFYREALESFRTENHMTMLINDVDDEYFWEFVGAARPLSFITPLSKKTIILSPKVFLRCTLVLAEPSSLLVRVNRVDSSSDETNEYRSVKIPYRVTKGLDQWGWSIGQVNKRDFCLYIDVLYDGVREYSKTIKMTI
jgi:hypothetical protein